MSDYTVEIIRSDHELTAQEKVAIKYAGDALKICDIVAAGDATLEVVGYALAQIHNENSESKDYERLFIRDTTGQYYTTSSPSLISKFCDMYDDMSSDGMTPAHITFGARESKKYTGKQFYTCYPCFTAD